MKHFIYSVSLLVLQVSCTSTTTTKKQFITTPGNETQVVDKSDTQLEKEFKDQWETEARKEGSIFYDQKNKEVTDYRNTENFSPSELKQRKLELQDDLLIKKMNDHDIGYDDGLPLAYTKPGNSIESPYKEGCFINYKHEISGMVLKCPYTFKKFRVIYE